ncbi:MAG: acetylxylan esterase [Gemmatales bacterium]|nr:acetylxylan esterase [Gemmatales bacterium]MDW8385752.1 acetylxylan esterase [Gemmatales bacterium]
MRRLASAFLSVFSLVGLALAAEDVTRVVQPPATLDDIRIKKPFHVDNPFPFEPRFPDRQSWERRAEELRTQVLVANGLWPMPPRAPLNPVIHGKIERDGYTVEKVYFASLPGHYVTGNLYRPKGMPGKRPGVLCPHGHWANGRLFERSEAEAKKEIESGAEKTMEGARYPLQARCAMLARMGCVVFMYDMVGYADSTKIPHTQGFADAEAELRLQSFMGLQTWNSIRALDFLTSLDEVDPQRIGVTGASGGGTQTFILCAIDPRPAASFPAVMVSTAMQGGCICENCSLLRIGTNNIELAALFAPKPQAMTGANDWTVDIERKGLPELKRIYGLYNAADRVEAKYFPFPHNYNQPSREMMYNWFNRHLQLGFPEPVVEQPFVPIAPKDLRVFDAEHPLPADAADAATLRQYLTRTSDAQLRELAKQPAEYRRVVGAALRAMVVDRMPETDAVKIVSQREITANGYKVRQVLLTREGTQEYVPTLAILPENWQGGVTVVTKAKGKAALFEESGQPGTLLRKLLEAGKAVVAPDVYLTGEFFAPDQEPKLPPLEQKYHRNVPFAGYTYGYNRTVLANRVRDTLTTLAYARQLNQGKAVDLLAAGDAAVWAFLARLLAGDAVGTAVLDLKGFDFDQVKRPEDAMMLPGALKYGGIHGLLPLCPASGTVVYGVPKGEPLVPVMFPLHRESVGEERLLAEVLK